MIFTSYMDHPLGQAFAAYVAADVKAEHSELCGLAGLASHTRFEPNAFSEALQIEALEQDDRDQWPEKIEDKLRKKHDQTSDLGGVIRARSARPTRPGRTAMHAA